MKNWKAYITLLLVFCLVVVMVACGEPEEPETSDTESASADDIGESTTPDAGTSGQPAESTTPTATTSGDPVSSEPESSEIESVEPEDPTSSEEETTTFPNYPSDDPDPFAVVGSKPESSSESLEGTEDPQN